MYLILFKPKTGRGTRSTASWAHRNLFWPLSRDGYLHGLGMSHATTVSLKPSFTTPWRVGDAVVSRGNAGQTTSKSGHPCQCQNYSQWPPAQKSGRGSLLNRPSCPPDDPVGQGTELLQIALMIYQCVRILYVLCTLFCQQDPPPPPPPVFSFILFFLYIVLVLCTSSFPLLFRQNHCIVFADFTIATLFCHECICVYVPICVHICRKR